MEKKTVKRILIGIAAVVLFLLGRNFVYNYDAGSSSAEEEQAAESQAVSGPKVSEVFDAVKDKADSAVSSRTFEFEPLASLPEIGNGMLQVHFIDIGQGDATLLITGESSDPMTCLIDTGSFSEWDRLDAYLQRMRIQRLDILICTHPHEDHIGSADKIIEKYDPGKIYAIDKESDEECYSFFLQSLQKIGKKATYVSAGDELSFGKAQICFLSPLPGKEYEDLNDYSLVTKVVYDDISFLFMGDCEEPAELDLAKSGTDLRADVLRTGHHGSYSSSSSKFLSKVRPSVAVISVGEGNEFGHPHDVSLERLKKAGARIVRTDESGTVVAATGGKKILWYSER